MFGQRIQLWWDLPLIDSFELLRHIYRVPRRALPRRACARFRDVLDLDPFLRHAGAPALARPAHPRRADRGDAARAGAALPRRADDRARRRRQAARARRSSRRSTRERGVTVLLTTHDLGDIERLCQRLLVIDHGTLIWDGGIDELKRALRRRADADRRPRGARAAAAARRRDASSASTAPRQWLRFRGSAAELTARVAATLRASSTCRSTEPDIEEIVRRIYEAPKPASYICSGASTPSRSRQRAITCCVDRDKAEPERLRGVAEHAALVVEAMEVVGEPDRIRREQLRAAPLAPPRARSPGSRSAA